MAGTAPGPVIDRVAPQPPRLGPSAAGIEHRQRRVVGEHLRRRQHRAEHQLVERRQPPARPPDPVRQRRAVQLDALSLQHLHLAIQRQGIRELADHHVRDQRLGRHAAVDGAVGRGGHDDGTLAAMAGVARPPGHPHPQLGGHHVELLGRQLADGVQRVAAARASAVLDVDHHLVARQVCRQGAVVAGRRLGARLARQASSSGRGVLAGLVGGDGLLQLLQGELQLVGRQLLGPAAELVAGQALDQQPQLVVLGGELALLEHAPSAASAAAWRRRRAGRRDRSAHRDDDRRRRVAASIFRRIGGFLARQFRPPHRHRRAPLAAVEQGGQLRRRQRDPAARCRGRPNELALLQPLGQHAQADPVMPDQLDQPSAAAPKGEHGAVERIGRKPCCTSIANPVMPLRMSVTPQAK